MLHVDVQIHLSVVGWDSAVGMQKDQEKSGLILEYWFTSKMDDWFPFHH